MVSEPVDLRRKYSADALSNFQSIGVLHEQGITLRNLGTLAAIEHDYEKAIEYNQSAQRFFEQVGDSLGVDSTRTNLAEYYIFLGKIEQAFHAFAELRQFNEKIGNRRKLGTSLSWESLAASRYGNLGYALQLRQKSLEIACEVSNQNDIAWHTWELGEIYRLMEDLDQAREYFSDAHQLFEKLNDLIGLGFFHRGYGEIAMLQSNWTEAQHQFQQALVLLEKEQRSGKAWGLACIHARIAVAFVHLGDFAEAKRHLKTSLSLAEVLAHPDLIALPLIGVSSLLAATGISEPAIEIAACIASQPTTWNEVKKQAGNILEAMMQSVPAQEGQLWMQRGEGLDLHTISKHYRDTL